MLSICSATAQVITRSGVNPTKADLKMQLPSAVGCANRYARTPKEAASTCFSGFTMRITALQAQSRG